MQRTSRVFRLWPQCVLAVSLAACPAGRAVSGDGGAADDAQAIAEVVVTAQRRPQSRMSYGGNIDRLGGAVLERVRHRHVSELMSRLAGAWIVRGSGQEHQTSIRSPVPTGGGACGNFLVLEDGIPVRPAGFCNVNQLAEVNTEQAASVEVIRGPGNALFGSNAVHGVVNVLMPEPGGADNPRVGIEAGANHFVRFRAALPFAEDSSWALSAVYADDGGFREASGYRQGKLYLGRRRTLANGELRVALSATDLDQDTAGFIYGRDAYRDPGRSRRNPDAGAFRDMESQRLYGIWTLALPRFDLDVRPYLRHTDMRFMHHGLPGKPVEENGHASAGVLSTLTFTRNDRVLVTGVDVEWGDLYLRQIQPGPAEGPPRVRETRPQGRHYDYDVASYSLAPFLQWELRRRAGLSFGAGVRVEFSRYRYDNRMLAGNTRDDGSECGFGGCLYSRPADRTDRFTNLSANLSVRRQLGAGGLLFASAASGYRVPQALELYRLQNGQAVADLDPERVDSLEAGWRGRGETWGIDLAAFVMRKRDGVYRDAEGFNVSGARSKHRGVEASVDWQPHRSWRLDLDASYARHSYDFNFDPGRGERFVAGRDIDTAPRWLGSAELLYEPGPALRFGIQWRVVGEYFLDAENRYRYPGHGLLNLQAGIRLSPRWDAVLRLTNATDRRFADRADFASGQYRYLPGRGRELFAELRYAPRAAGSE
jgi:iron complex outermembrane receptor protein